LLALSRVVGFATFGCDWPSNWRRNAGSSLSGPLPSHLRWAQRPIDSIPADIHNPVVALAPEIRHDQAKGNEAVRRNRESREESIRPEVALFGSAVMSDLSPECARKRTPADHSEIYGFTP
jgi:hypothetical protein